MSSRRQLPIFPQHISIRSLQCGFETAHQKLNDYANRHLRILPDVIRRIRNSKCSPRPPRMQRRPRMANHARRRHRRLLVRLLGPHPPSSHPLSPRALRPPRTRPAPPPAPPLPSLMDDQRLPRRLRPIQKRHLNPLHLPRSLQPPRIHLHRHLLAKTLALAIPLENHHPRPLHQVRLRPPRHLQSRRPTPHPMPRMRQTNGVHANCLTRHRASPTFHAVPVTAIALNSFFEQARAQEDFPPPSCLGPNARTEYRECKFDFQGIAPASEQRRGGHRCV